MAPHSWAYDEIQRVLENAPDDPGAVLLTVGTSGSTGAPKLARLTARALVASARSTIEVLGGPGQWLLATPATHIAGIQVLVRSAVTGIEPVVMEPGGFTPNGFGAAAGRLKHERRYVSLVPTQVLRLLQDPAARDALAGFTAVLVGGAAVPPTLRAAARDAGAHIIATYGMSETAGGCVYDGHPLPVTRMRITDPDGEGVGIIDLGGETLAQGYEGRPQLTEQAFHTDRDGMRWFRTDDLGRIEDGVLSVLGRRDDVINTGGLKVAPHVVEEAVAQAFPDLAGCSVVLATANSQWGEAVTLAVAAAEVPPLAVVRDALRGLLPPAALPARVERVGEIPYLGPGKPDRRALREQLAPHTS